MTSSLRPDLKIVHTSDVHLGAYDAGNSGDSVHLEEAFTAVVNLAIAEDADLVIIAGDFFDNSRVKETTLQFAASELARLNRPTVIGPGNHDHVGPYSVYDRFDLATLAPNVTLLRGRDGETAVFEDLNLEIWGRSHTETLMDFSPFEGIPERGQYAWSLAVGHGHFIHPKALLHHSFHILESELAASGRDYVALGHWEQMTRVAAGDTVAAYSGASEGLGGHNGGHALRVNLNSDGSVRVTALPLQEGGSIIEHENLPFLEGLDPNSLDV